VVAVIVRQEQHIDRPTELPAERTSLLTRVDEDVTPLVRREGDSLPQPLPLHVGIGAPVGSRVRHITVQHHMLDHGTTVKTRGRERRLVPVV
jgi:hypothetical protein